MIRIMRSNKVFGTCLFRAIQYGTFLNLSDVVAEAVLSLVVVEDRCTAPVSMKVFFRVLCEWQNRFTLQRISFLDRSFFADFLFTQSESARTADSGILF